MILYYVLSSLFPSVKETQQLLSLQNRHHFFFFCICQARQRRSRLTASVKCRSRLMLASACLQKKKNRKKITPVLHGSSYEDKAMSLLGYQTPYHAKPLPFLLQLCFLWRGSFTWLFHLLRWFFEVCKKCPRSRLLLLFGSESKFPGKNVLLCPKTCTIYQSVRNNKKFAPIKKLIRFKMPTE